jgi:hypothetical protein
MSRTSLRGLGLLLLGGLCLVLQPAGVAAPVGVDELRIQKVGDVTCFHVRVATPKDMIEADAWERHFLDDFPPASSPRLVSPDEKVRLICRRIGNDGRNPGARIPDRTPNLKDAPAPPRGKDDPRQPVPVQGLEFVGRTEATGEVKMKLLYPIRGRRVPLVGRLSRRPPPLSWREVEVVLDFAKAKGVEAPAEAKNRKPTNPPVRDDLEGLWAVAQVDQFAELDADSHEFGFYGFAATATARKYGVPASPTLRSWDRTRNRPADSETRQLFETTTGAAAISESLQLRRMNAVAPPKGDERTVPIAKVRGIDIAEHPWKEMIGDKSPAPEAFARMVPHDNYYIHFKAISRFLDFTELIDQWGTNLTRAYEVTSRDHKLKDRYQQQLCLRSTELGRTLGPLVIKGIALTGNDAYIREGSDLAVLFQVVSPKVFLGAVDPFIVEARKKFGKMNETKGVYKGVDYETFVTPLREVSLHRATVGDVVVYANSPVGLRRILDTQEGRIKRLSESLDFQYMRTIFRYDDKAEDGFAFLSDAFIRNLVGPASKIKERRRLEALSSLYMLTNGAMLTAWESGKPPVSTPKLFEFTSLKSEEVPMSEGKAAVWDSEHLVAVSDAYNTIHFATPLVELPIEEVTRTEAAEYDRFRLEYMGLWRQFFDPIGMRVSLKENKVQLDTYILPLIQNTQYNELRRITGQKSVKFDPSSISDKTLGQFLIRLSGNSEDRLGLFGLGGRRGGFDLLALLASALDPVGEWFLVRADDSPVYEELLKLSQRLEQGGNVDTEKIARQIWALPIAVGVDIKNPLVFAAAIAAARNEVMRSLPGALTWEPLEKKYKDVSIVRIQATARGAALVGGAFRDGRDRKNAFAPTVYYALIDGGFFVTLNEEMIFSLIDGAAAKRDGKTSVEVASSLYLAPKAAVQTKALFRSLLEQQTHQQARTSLPIWYALHRTGIVAADATPEQARTSAYRYLGFVPVSPDGSKYA